MNTYKAYKLRIYPTDSQRELIEKTFGCTRYIYNNFLAERKNKYEESKIKINVYEQLKELTDLKREKEWLREIDSCVLQACVYNLDDAFQGFFHGKGYPKFRAKGVHDNFRTNNISVIQTKYNYTMIAKTKNTIWFSCLLKKIIVVYDIQKKRVKNLKRLKL